MRGLLLNAAFILSLFMAGAAQADIAPEPGPPPPQDMPTGSLAVAGTALALGAVSFGIWLRKRRVPGKSN